MGDSSNGGFVAPGSNQLVLIGQYGVSEGSWDAMGLKLKAERWFDLSRPMDEMTMSNVVGHNAPAGG